MCAGRAGGASRVLCSVQGSVGEETRSGASGVGAWLMMASSDLTAAWGAGSMGRQSGCF